VEGVLVPAKRLPLTRQRWRWGLATADAGQTERSGSNGAVATEGVRGRATCSGAADNAVAGRQRVEGLSIEALPDHAVLRQGAVKATSRVVAEPKLGVRRQAKLHLMT